jgi:hypothetical protein
LRLGGAESAFFDFLDGTDYSSPATQTRLLATANDASNGEFVRRKAAQLFTKVASVVELETLSRTSAAEVRDIFDDVLVRRQHVPTIKTRLSILLGNPDILRAAERPFPDDPAIQWVGHINTRDVWALLASLWRQTLKLSLPTCTRIVETTLLRIDADFLVEMMRSTAKKASPELAEDLYYRAGVYEYQRDIDAAKRITFELVIRQLAKNTTLKRIKVWCEGPTDTPAFKSLLAKTCADRMEVISIQGIGGWATALNPHYDFAALLDGCLWAVVIMDGDNGRDFSRSGHPPTKLTIRLKRKLDPLNIPLRVLDRYGIENYFAQHALESVLGQKVTSVFPMREDKSIRDMIPTYNKNLNARVIEKMSLKDLAGTDLELIITEIRKWADA